MGLSKIVGETALELVKSDNVQNKAVGLFGMLFPYMGMEKRAVDLYIEEIEKSDLSTDAKMISLFNAKKTLKKLKNQKRVAEIATENAKEGTDFSESAKVDEEWLDRFMDAASFVSSEEMQLVWGKILANEFETPGCTPPNMIRILSEFTHTYAKAFRTLCSMQALLVSVADEVSVSSARRVNIVDFEQRDGYANKVGLSFELLNELETLGVIKFNAAVGYVATNMTEKRILVCIGNSVIETSMHQDDNFPIGNVIFTEAGDALSKITEPYELKGYDEAVRQYLSSHNVIVEEESSYNVFLLGEIVRISKKECVNKTL